MLTTPTPEHQPTSAEKDAGCRCGHPADDHDDAGACMHLCDCAWPDAEKGC